MPTVTQPIFLKADSTYSPRRKPILTPTSFKPEKPSDNWNDISEPEIEYFETDSQLKVKVEEAKYWEKYYDNSDENYEWNNGYLEIKPVSEHLTTLMHDWFTKLISYYLDTQQIGQKICLEMGFRLALPNKTVIRKPDYGVILHTNPVPFKSTGETYTYQGICDLCVEALSDSTPQEIKRDTETKFREYEAAGVKEYYILYAKDDELMAFYRLNENGMYVPIKPKSGNVIQSSVLPGFQFRPDDLYRRPELSEMACDPVYEFVFPAYKKVLQEKEQERREKELALRKAEQERQEKERERQAKELALQKAEQERQEKELAQQKVAEMAEQLRKLGIDPDKL